MNNRHSTAHIVAAAFLALAVVANAPAEEAPEPVDLEAPLANLAEGWNTITPGGSTTCADGSPFRFFVHKADPTQLVFYLQGGGGCWSAETCDPQGRPTYRRSTIEQMRSASGAAPEARTAHGIAAFNHPENPLADHSFVFVPYCTGDVHIGDRDMVYEIPATDEAPAREFTIHHRGYTNGRTALDWTYDHFPGLETVFVSGSSAGSAASPVYARHFAENYPAARVTTVADCSGGYRNLPGRPGSRPHESWGALPALSHFENMSEVGADGFSYQALYIQAAKAHPEAMFTRYDTAEDRLQIRFLEIAGANVDNGMQPLLDANEADIDAALEGQDNHRSYIAPGEMHTIMLRPQFYTYESDGVKFRDWVAALVAGEPVSDVHCGDCTDSPEPEAMEADEAPGP